MTERDIDNAVIDAALHHVENQAVLRALLEGKPWSDAFGIGGGAQPVPWQGDSKGIVVNFGSDNPRLIKPAQILKRAKEYAEGDGVDFCQEAERKRQAPEIDLFAHFNANSLQAEAVTL